MRVNRTSLKDCGAQLAPSYNSRAGHTKFPPKILFVDHPRNLAPTLLACAVNGIGGSALAVYFFLVRCVDSAPGHQQPTSAVQLLGTQHSNTASTGLKDKSSSRSLSKDIIDADTEFDVDDTLRDRGYGPSGRSCSLLVKSRLRSY